MKKNILFIGALLLGLHVHAQIVDIPDANFKNALVNDEVADLGNFFYEDVDTNNDGEIQLSEAEAVVRLNVNFYAISSMEGIEYFINIFELECEDNLLTSLDITQNINLSALYCGNNSITELDVSQNINLGILWCYQNEISSLDVTMLPSLLNLHCRLNNLNELDVSQNLNLSTLYCGFNNLTQLEVSLNTSLALFSCVANNISNLDVTQNIKLYHLFCSSNDIEELDLSQNEFLQVFQGGSNINLNYLDLRNGNNSDLTTMWANETPNLHCIFVDDAEYANTQDCNYPINGWCTDLNDLYIEDIVDCILGLNDTTISRFLLYPNPVQDVLLIESQQSIETVKIYNLQGQIVHEVSSNSINVSKFTSGLYFLQVTIDGKSKTKKFIKE